MTQGTVKSKSSQMQQGTAVTESVRLHTISGDRTSVYRNLQRIVFEGHQIMRIMSVVVMFQFMTSHYFPQVVRETQPGEIL